MNIGSMFLRSFFRTERLDSQNTLSLLQVKSLPMSGLDAELRKHDALAQYLTALFDPAGRGVVPQDQPPTRLIEMKHSTSLNMPITAPTNPRQSIFPTSGAIVVSASRGCPAPITMFAPIAGRGQTNTWLLEGGVCMATETAATVGPGALASGMFSAAYPSAVTRINDSSYSGGMFNTATTTGGQAAVPFGLLPDNMASLPITMYTGFIYTDATEKFSQAPSPDQLARQASRGREITSILSAVSTTSSDIKFNGQFQMSNVFSTAGIMCSGKIGGNPTISAATLQQQSARPGDSCVNVFVQDGGVILSGPAISSLVLPLDFKFIMNDASWTGVAPVWSGQLEAGHATSAWDGTYAMVANAAYRQNAWCDSQVGRAPTAPASVYNQYMAGITGYGVSPTPAFTATNFPLPTMQRATFTDVCTQGHFNTVQLCAAGQVSTDPSVKFSCPKMETVQLPPLPVGWNYGFDVELTASDTALGRFPGLVIPAQEAAFDNVMIPIAPIGTLQPLVQSTTAAVAIARSGLSQFQLFTGAALGSAVNPLESTLFASTPGFVGIRALDGATLLPSAACNNLFLAQTHANIRYTTWNHPGSFSAILGDGSHPGGDVTLMTNARQCVYGSSCATVDSIMFNKPASNNRSIALTAFCESTLGVDGTASTLIGGNQSILPFSLFAVGTMYTTSIAWLDPKRTVGTPWAFTNSQANAQLIGGMMAPSGAATSAFSALSTASSPIINADVFVQATETYPLYGSQIWCWSSAVPYISGYDSSVTGHPITIHPNTYTSDATQQEYPSAFPPTAAWKTGFPATRITNAIQGQAAAISSWVIGPSIASGVDYYGNQSADPAQGAGVGLGPPFTAGVGVGPRNLLGQANLRSNWAYFAILGETAPSGNGVATQMFAADAAPIMSSYFTTWTGVDVPIPAQGGAWVPVPNPPLEPDPVITARTRVGFETNFTYVNGAVLAPGAPISMSTCAGAEGSYSVYPMALVYSTAQQGSVANLAGAATALFSVPVNTAIVTGQDQAASTIGAEVVPGSSFDTSYLTSAGLPAYMRTTQQGYLGTNNFSDLAFKLCGFHVPSQGNTRGDGAPLGGAYYGLSTTTTQFGGYPGASVTQLATAKMLNPIGTSLTGPKNAVIMATHIYCKWNSVQEVVQFSSVREEQFVDIGSHGGVAVSCANIYNPVGNVLAQGPAGPKGAAVFTAADFSRMQSCPVISGGGVKRTYRFTTPNPLAYPDTYVCTLISYGTYADGILTNVMSLGERKNGHCPFYMSAIKALALGLYATGEHQAQVVAWNDIGPGQQLTVARTAAIQIEASKDLVPFQPGGTGSANGAQGAEICDPRVPQVSRLLWTNPVTAGSFFKHCWPQQEYERFRKELISMDPVAALGVMLRGDEMSMRTIMSAFGSTSLSAGATFQEAAMAHDQDYPEWGSAGPFGRTSGIGRAQLQPILKDSAWREQALTELMQRDADRKTSSGKSRPNLDRSIRQAEDAVEREARKKYLSTLSPGTIAAMKHAFHVNEMDQQHSEDWAGTATTFLNIRAAMGMGKVAIKWETSTWHANYLYATINGQFTLGFSLPHSLIHTASRLLFPREHGTRVPVPSQFIDQLSRILSGVTGVSSNWVGHWKELGQEADKVATLAGDALTYLLPMGDPAKFNPDTIRHLRMITAIHSTLAHELDLWDGTLALFSGTKQGPASYASDGMQKLTTFMESNQNWNRLLHYKKKTESAYESEFKSAGGEIEKIIKNLGAFFTSLGSPKSSNVRKVHAVIGMVVFTYLDAQQRKDFPTASLDLLRPSTYAALTMANPAILVMREAMEPGRVTRRDTIFDDPAVKNAIEEHGGIYQLTRLIDSEAAQRKATATTRPGTFLALRKSMVKPEASASPARSAAGEDAAAYVDTN